MEDAIIAAKLINNLLNKEVFLIDVGANIGKYSETLLENIDKKSSSIKGVVMIEAIPELKERLRQVSISNKEIFSIAIDSKKDKKVFYYTPESISKSSLSNRPAYRQLGYKEPKKIQVNTDLLSSILDNSNYFKLCKNNSAYLKIDIEGYENEAIRSLSTHHFKKIIAGQFEYGGCWQERRLKAGNVIKLLSVDYDLFFQHNSNLIKIDPLSFVENYRHTNIFFIKKGFSI